MQGVARAVPVAPEVPSTRSDDPPGHPSLRTIPQPCALPLASRETYLAGMALASLAERSPIPPIEAARDRTSPGRVTGKLLIAMTAMVWQGLSRREAAAKAGISEHSLYKALRRPPVRAYYSAELEVLRTSERARNIHTLAEVRDQKTNQMARVQAVKALEQLDDEVSARRGSAFSASPGLIINILNTSVTESPSAQRQHQVIDNSADCDQGSDPVYKPVYKP